MHGLKWMLAVVAAAAMLLGLAAPAADAQENYPNRPIRLIVGFIPGSAADITARALSNHLSKSLGQPVVVEARPGAGSSLAAEHVARAPKDGYTLFLASSANVNNAVINPKLPFDLAKDFAPIALVNNAAVVLVVHPSVGVKSLKDLIALIKAKPDAMSYASTGVGTAPHLSGELLGMRIGAKLLHIPYKGSPAAAADVLAGRVPMMFSPATAVIPHIQAGKLVPIAAATRERTGSLPDVPTMQEAGMSNFVTSIWFGLVAPAGTPQPIVDRLAKAVDDAVQAPEVVKIWAPQGIDPLRAGPSAFADHIASELKLWGEVAQTAGLVKK